MNAEQAEREQLARDDLIGRQRDVAMTSSARCGLEGCDCEYTIGGLLRRLELIAEQANVAVKQTRLGPSALYTECDDTCPCFVAGTEAERRPLGS